jgi:3-hydroxyacyl-CoA dehydrogenase
MTLSVLQGKFAEAVRTSEEEIARRTRRIQDLEAENERQQAEISRLQRENARMKAAAEASAREPRDGVDADLQNVTEERDRLQKHLKHANRYIRTLLTSNVSSLLIHSYKNSVMRPYSHLLLLIVLRQVNLQRHRDSVVLAPEQEVHRYLQGFHPRLHALQKLL